MDSFPVCQRYIGITDFFSNWLRKYCDENKPIHTFYLTSGVDGIDMCSPTIKSSPVTDLSTHYRLKLVFGGTISKTTYHELRQVVDVVSANSDVALFICGDGYYLDKLKEIALSDNIFVLGNLPYAQFRKLKTVRILV